jgi:cytochrome P450
VALLGAGTDTTRHQLAAAVDLLCDHPDQWALLGERPELIPRAVEEAMRYRPIGFGLPRIATEDVELAGVRIPTETIVLANTAAANRDPAARLELAEALTVMTQRMPNLRRTGPAPWPSMVGVTGPATLPVEFDLTRS